MANIPKKVNERFVQNLKKFQSIISSARDRDINEADTVTIVTDLLSDLFGYDKYSEITAEQLIKGTYCDLAIKIENETRFIIEVKAVGIDLKDAHVKQAIDYAANKGIEWAILTNGVIWQIYKVVFSKPIDHELVLGFNFLELNPRGQADLDNLFLLCKEAINKSLLSDYHTQKQATSRFVLSAVILSEPVMNAIRREVKRLSPDIKVTNEELKEVIIQSVMKREVVEGESAEEANKKVRKAAKVKIRKVNKEKEDKDVQKQRAEPDTISIEAINIEPSPNEEEQSG